MNLVTCITTIFDIKFNNYNLISIDMSNVCEQNSRAYTRLAIKFMNILAPLQDELIQKKNTIIKFTKENQQQRDLQCREEITEIQVTQLKTQMT